MASIQSTAYPSDKLKINEWYSYISGVPVKPKKLKNTPKKGGVCFENECKKVLYNAKRVINKQI